MTIPARPLPDLIEELTGRRFSNPALLRAALTHSSAGNVENYERLEFLGDRVLGLAVAELLYTAFPLESEGALAKRLAVLVQASTLARIARERLDLGSALIVSGGVRGAGTSSDNENILADSLEALLGALYLDSGIAPCLTFVRTLWKDAVLADSTPPRDPKTALQEWAQGRGLPLPAYDLVCREGPDHAPLFKIRVQVEGLPPREASGSSRRAAEKAAAQTLLDLIEGKAS